MPSCGRVNWPPSLSSDAPQKGRGGRAYHESLSSYGSPAAPPSRRLFIGVSAKTGPLVGVYGPPSECQPRPLPPCFGCLVPYPHTHPCSLPPQSSNLSGLSRVPRRSLNAAPPPGGLAATWNKVECRSGRYRGLGELSFPTPPPRGTHALCPPGPRSLPSTFSSPA